MAALQGIQQSHRMTLHYVQGLRLTGMTIALDSRLRGNDDVLLKSPVAPFVKGGKNEIPLFVRDKDFSLRSK